MYRPVDFEGAREMAYWEPVMRGLRAAVRLSKAQKHQEMVRAHNRWQRHWRTRLSSWLHSLASNIELPEPPLPERGKG